MELDLYWAVHAGADAAQLIDRLSTRLYAFHVKDMKKDKTMAAVGAGTIDFAALFKRPGASQVTHFYVRSEEHTSELQSLMRISYAVFCLKKKKHKKQT